MLHGTALASEGSGNDYPILCDIVNATSIGPAKAFLLGTPASVVCLQEHHVPPGDAMLELQTWAHDNGWQSLWSPASLRDTGGSVGGTAILVREPLSIMRPSEDMNSHVVSERATVAKVEIPGAGAWSIASVYLQVGVGPSLANLECLAKWVRLSVD